VRQLLRFLGIEDEDQAAGHRVLGADGQNTFQETGLVRDIPPELQPGDRVAGNLVLDPSFPF